MARPRVELQSLLEVITDHVYFQSPTNNKMSYPCIIYARDGGESEYANNRPYARTKKYQVTVIDRDPNSNLPDIVEDLPLCSFDRFFTADNLNHYVFTLFF